MSAPQGIVSYPGLATFTKAEYVLSQGISPGKCTIELPQNLVTGLQPTGNLTFEYNDLGIALPNCLLDSAHIDQSEKGYIARITILDRRWLWKFGYISGHYNLRMPGGANADEGFNSTASNNQEAGDGNNIRPGTEQAPQDLATLCLQAMNEQNYDVSALPNDSRPEIDWSYANPAEALQSLCESLGCRVVYWLADDSVRIVSVGQGQPLPDNGLQTFISEGIDPPNTPSSIKLVGGPWVFQGFIPLTAVGIDTDGSVQELDDLSYAPDNGWETEDPNGFPSFNDEPDVLPLVEKSIYKMWRVDGPIQVPSNDAPDVTDMRQLRLYNRLVDTHFDPNDATKTVPKKPEIWGSFDPKYGQTVQTPDSTQGTYKNGITVDEDRWLIITEDQLYSVSNGKYSPANIQVKIAYSVRDSDTWEFFRYTQDLQLSSAVPTQPRIIRHEDIFGKSVGTFDNNFDLTDFTDNTDSDDLNAEANYYLQAAAQEYIEQDSLDVPYAGLVPIQVDGLIQQVTYSISSGPGGSTMTRASLATEHNPYVLPWSVRRRNEKERNAAYTLTQFGRSVLDTRTGGFSRDARPSAVDVSTKCNAMPQELSSRFAGRIRWIGFENQSGQDIPPYSIVEASGWQMPDPSGSDVSVTSPIVLGEQPGDPINPYACYITGAASVPAGGNGVCAQPTLDLPLLVALSGPQQDNNDAPFRLCGPSNGSWTATRDMPGFAMVDSPQQGYALVVPAFGPYRGQIQTTINVQQSGTVFVITGPKTSEQASKAQIPNVYNPYASLSASSGAPIRVTFDWVGDNNGSWELIAANPCLS